MLKENPYELVGAKARMIKAVTMMHQRAEATKPLLAKKDLASSSAIK